MKFLLENNIISFNVRFLVVMFQVFLDHFIGNIACTPNTKSNCPKMPPPISFSNVGIFFLKSPRGSSFQSLNQLAHRLRRGIFYVDVNMILAYDPFQYFNIFRITNLLYQISTTRFNIAFQNMITIFSYPNYMGSKLRNCMISVSLGIFHARNLEKCVATESLALKAHSFN